MKSNLKFIDAISADSELLSETCKASKKIWGYSDELIQLWKSDLEISEAYILNNKVVKVYDGESFVGFFAIKFSENENPEIDHLWLKPENIRRNYGREIFKFMTNFLSSNNYKMVTLIAEPNAIGFYEKMGGINIGKFESKVSGRFLDIYEYRL